MRKYFVDKVKVNENDEVILNEQTSFSRWTSFEEAEFDYLDKCESNRNDNEEVIMYSFNFEVNVDYSTRENMLKLIEGMKIVCLDEAPIIKARKRN